MEIDILVEAIHDMDNKYYVKFYYNKKFD